jgi:hypothetical protein
VREQRVQVEPEGRLHRVAAPQPRVERVAQRAQRPVDVAVRVGGLRRGIERQPRQVRVRERGVLEHEAVVVVDEAVAQPEPMSSQRERHQQRRRPAADRRRSTHRGTLSVRPPAGKPRVVRPRPSSSVGKASHGDQQRGQARACTSPSADAAPGSSGSRRSA